MSSVLRSPEPRLPALPVPVPSSRRPIAGRSRPNIENIDLGKEVYVGLFVGSHNSDVLETGVFSNVSISVPFNGVSNQQTPMTLGSNLELLEVASGNREVIYKVPYSIQAPNWTPDGKSLIFNDYKGLLYNFDLTAKKPVQINTGNVTNNNNDHVLTFDGKQIGLSSNVKELGGSIIYVIPVTGGTPKQITPKGPSYLHGWSPDGKSLVYCASRDGEYDVYKVSSSGGGEVRLTNTKGLTGVARRIHARWKIYLLQFCTLRYYADLANETGRQ